MATEKFNKAKMEPVDVGWKEMAVILDREMPQRKNRGILWWFMGTAAMIGIAAFVFLMQGDLQVADHNLRPTNQSEQMSTGSDQKSDIDDVTISDHQIDLSSNGTDRSSATESVVKDDPSKQPEVSELVTSSDRERQIPDQRDESDIVDAHESELIPNQLKEHKGDEGVEKPLEQTNDIQSLAVADDVSRNEIRNSTALNPLPVLDPGLLHNSFQFATFTMPQDRNITSQTSSSLNFGLQLGSFVGLDENYVSLAIGTGIQWSFANSWAIEVFPAIEFSSLNTSFEDTPSRDFSAAASVTAGSLENPILMTIPVTALYKLSPKWSIGGGIHYHFMVKEVLGSSDEAAIVTQSATDRDPTSVADQESDNMATIGVQSINPTHASLGFHLRAKYNITSRLRFTLEYQHQYQALPRESQFLYQLNTKMGAGLRWKF